MSEEQTPSPLPTANCWSAKQPESPGATNDEMKSSRSSGRADLIAKVGTIVSAIMASSCCWLPPLLILMGVSGAGMTKALEAYRPLFIIVTTGFLAAAFYMTYRPRKSGAEDCCKPNPKRRFSMMTLNKIMLWAVTVMAVVFLFFPSYVMGLFPSGGEFTPDMNRTVISVDGMTCLGWELKAEMAIKSAPGVLAVKADYESGQATVGTGPNDEVPMEQILAALESIGYEGKTVEGTQVLAPTGQP